MRPLPPARYRIEEQGRRLVVIDQWQGNTPVGAAPAAAASPAAPPSPSPRRQAGAAAGPSLAGPALWLIGSRQDAGGRPLLTTHRFYDPQGPRRIALSDRAIAQLQAFGVAALAVTMIFIVILLFVPPAAFVIGFLLLRGGTALKPRIGAWLDGAGSPAD